MPFCHSLKRLESLIMGAVQVGTEVVQAFPACADLCPLNVLGPVMSRLLKDYQISDSCSLTCSDFSESMVEKVEQIKEKSIKEESNSIWKRVHTVVQNAMDLQSIQDSSMSHVTAGWVRCYFGRTEVPLLTIGTLRCTS